MIRQDGVGDLGRRWAWAAGGNGTTSRWIARERRAAAVLWTMIRRRAAPPAAPGAADPLRLPAAVAPIIRAVVGDHARPDARKTIAARGHAPQVVALVDHPTGGAMKMAHRL